MSGHAIAGLVVLALGLAYFVFAAFYADRNEPLARIVRGYPDEMRIDPETFTRTRVHATITARVRLAEIEWQRSKLYSDAAAARASNRSRHVLLLARPWPSKETSH